ncbi:MAG: isoprenylcysteine carboxylmethyltransferase family protein [Anaerolineales bacterium]|nr:isoprenylcysteine carboxylmethyltransferase family protein [Anaerolineales bacterium]
MGHTEQSKPNLLKGLAIRLGLGIPCLVAMLFLPAGTLAYWEAWIYLAVILIPMTFALIVLYRKAPELLERRMRMREKEATQRKIINLSLLYFLVVFMLPGFDKRFGWSNVPVAVVLVGDLIVLLGYCFILYVFRENQYASRVVEVDEGQQVISTGPYAVVRHPMYLGVTLMYVFSPLALGSYWAMIPALLIIPILVMRIRNEEEVLSRELAGYPAYTQQIRYRLLPGIW